MHIRSGRVGWHGLGLLLASFAAGAEVPVCVENRYGSPAQAAAIERRMQSGSVDEVVLALRAAQATRGIELGCAESAYAYGGGDVRAPLPGAIAQAWRVHADSASAALAAYDVCPALGRSAGAYALGGWLARRGGLAFDEAALRTIADNLRATQYLSERTPGALSSWPGMFGYAEVLGDRGHACHVPGVVGAGVATVCSVAPELCVVYAGGRFAGQRFAVGDYASARDIRDGGGAFDQGWAGVMMVEAALGASAAEDREAFRRSALAAGEWALAEPPVRNHNYTAKLVWLLAVLYDWTGDTRYRDGLLDKLERNLLPGVLMDLDADGFVDGHAQLRFADLRAPAARVPGRMWDAHNALPWYQAMNAWAMVEAYVALRSRGDSAWSDRLRPFALAMLDNLAAELAPGGGLPPDGPGTTQVAYAFAVGLWKLADAEGLARPAWEQGLWAIWNAGLGVAPGDNKTATAAIVALRAAGIAHRSHAQRVGESMHPASPASRVSGAWFDPARSGEGVSIIGFAPDRLSVTWFTYDPWHPDRQAWITAEGGFDGERFDGRAQITRGTRFGEAFDAGAVERIDWGDLGLSFAGCRATLRWRSVQPGFGEGARELHKLAGIDGAACAR